MKKYFLTAVLAVTLCFTVLMSAVNAQDFRGRAHYDKTTSRTTKTVDGNHTRTVTRSRSHGVFGEAHITGVDGNDLKSFYRAIIKPYVKNNPNVNYQYSYTPPKYNPPKSSFKNMPGFNTPKMPSMPSMPSYGF